MTTDSTTPSTKTRYLRDPKRPDRVVTLVTKVEGDKLTFATAVNAPPRKAEYYDVHGDTFSRKTGSLIAHGRLENSRSSTTITFDPTKEHPLLVVLEHLSKAPPSSMTKIVKSQLKTINAKGGLTIRQKAA